MLISIKSGLTMATIAALAACGGGGGDDTPITPAPGPVAQAPAPAPAPAPAVPTTASVAVTVLDGPILNALVCLDANRNGVCDAGETQGRTDAAGKVTLAAPTADVGKYPVVAMIGTDAVDADSGAVTAAYTLKAPADQATVVSPYSTLIERAANASGSTSAEAEAVLRASFGQTISLFENYTGRTDTRMATMAATMAVVMQQLGSALAPNIGKADISGGTISAADISTEVTNTLLDRVATVKRRDKLATLRTPCATSVSTADCKAAVTANAAFLVTDPGENKLNATNIGVAVGERKRIANAGPAAVPVENGALTFLVLTDPLNWETTGFVSTAAEATPVNGTTKSRDVSTVSTAGVITTFGVGGLPVDSALHWSGSAWVNCPAGYQNTSKVRDENGVGRDIDYCNGASITATKRIGVDISGKLMSEVVNQIKLHPYSNFGPYGRSFATWGPSGTPAEITAALGGAVFPANSRVLYQSNLSLSAAPAYQADDSNTVSVFSADVATGGDARTNSTLPCALTATAAPASTLEQLIVANPGKPCVFGPGTMTGANGVVLNSGNTNEAWGLTSASLGSLGSAPLGTASTATTYYTTNQLLRVSFAGAGSNVVTFYQCQQRAINGSTRNCASVGNGTFTVATLGDARVLTFSDIPSAAALRDAQRVFVERAGKVYFGSQDKLVASNRVRLSLDAGNALINTYVAKGYVGLKPLTP
ncbi:MAG: hypothetical protein JWP29_2174 [Rhodoferax sp.]|nr:hypothetical protein [Rhodoferax sp.]